MVTVWMLRTWVVGEWLLGTSSRPRAAWPLQTGGELTEPVVLPCVTSRCGLSWRMVSSAGL